MHNLIIKTSDLYNAKEMIKVALDEKLYIPGFGLYGLLKEVLQFSDSSFKIHLLYVDGKASGIAVYTYTNSFSVQIFIKEEQRRKGYGKALLSSLVNKLDEKEKRAIRVGIGTEESFPFWGDMVDEGILNATSVPFYEIIGLMKEGRRNNTDLLHSESVFEENLENIP